MAQSSIAAKTAVLLAKPVVSIPVARKIAPVAVMNSNAVTFLASAATLLVAVICHAARTSRAASHHGLVVPTVLTVLAAIISVAVVVTLIAAKTQLVVTVVKASVTGACVAKTATLLHRHAIAIVVPMSEKRVVGLFVTRLFVVSVKFNYHSLIYLPFQ